MALRTNPESIELDDIQGLMIFGYGQLPVNHFFFLKIIHPESVRHWIHQTVPLITSATQYEKELSLNMAFTHAGLKAIGLSEVNLKNFPTPFKVGMADKLGIRQNILGDFGDSAPENWYWGGRPKVDRKGAPGDRFQATDEFSIPGTNNPRRDWDTSQEEIHMLLAIYASGKEQLDVFREKMEKSILSVEYETEDSLTPGQRLHKKKGLDIIYDIGGYRRDDSKEQFGFHDSISQPVIKGSGRKGPEKEMVAPGEFVLGYLNEYNLYPYSPLITDSQGDLNLLPADAAESGHKDLGRNGTFIAFRQIQQHVDDFWNFMREKTLKPNGQEDENAKVKLASKMIGRWPEGAPLVKHPDNNPRVDDEDNDFGYAKEDPHGYKCPLGSHLRRNNPRDSFRDMDSKISLMVSHRHRIIRRGRLYDLSRHGIDERGLLFMGLNADIQQQFEFIQHIWANNLQPNKATLFNDPDPIIGVPDPDDPKYRLRADRIPEMTVPEFLNLVKGDAIDRLNITEDEGGGKIVWVYIRESKLKQFEIGEPSHGDPQRKLRIQSEDELQKKIEQARREVADLHGRTLEVIPVTREVNDYRFTIQRDPVSRYISGLQRFVTIRGGAYFFLPSISAIRYLTTLGTDGTEGGGD